MLTLRKVSRMYTVLLGRAIFTHATYTILHIHQPPD